MDILKEYGNMAVAFVVGCLAWMFGAWDIMLQVLVAFIIIDYVTGVMVAMAEKKLSSRCGYKGILKKVGILICVCIAVLTDRMLGTEALRVAIILVFVGNEGISILENVAKLGVPIPQKLLDALLQLKGNDNKGT